MLMYVIKLAADAVLNSISAVNNVLLYLFLTFLRYTALSPTSTSGPIYHAMIKGYMVFWGLTGAILLASFLWGLWNIQRYSLSGGGVQDDVRQLISRLVGAVLLVLFGWVMIYAMLSVNNSIVDTVNRTITSGLLTNIKDLDPLNNLSQYHQNQSTMFDIGSAVSSAAIDLLMPLILDLFMEIVIILLIVFMIWAIVLWVGRQFELIFWMTLWSPTAALTVADPRRKYFEYVKNQMVGLIFTQAMMAIAIYIVIQLPSWLDTSRAGGLANGANELFVGLIKWGLMTAGFWFVTRIPRYWREVNGHSTSGGHEIAALAGGYMLGRAGGAFLSGTKGGQLLGNRLENHKIHNEDALTNAYPGFSAARADTQFTRAHITKMNNQDNDRAGVYAEQMAADATGAAGWNRAAEQNPNLAMLSDPNKFQQLQDRKQNPPDPDPNGPPHSPGPQGSPGGSGPASASFSHATAGENFLAEPQTMGFQKTSAFRGASPTVLQGNAHGPETSPSSAKAEPASSTLPHTSMTPDASWEENQHANVPNDLPATPLTDTSPAPDQSLTTMPQWEGDAGIGAGAAMAVGGGAAILRHVDHEAAAHSSSANAASAVPPTYTVPSSHRDYFAAQGRGIQTYATENMTPVMLVAQRRSVSPQVRDQMTQQYLQHAQAASSPEATAHFMSEQLGYVESQPIVDREGAPVLNAQGEPQYHYTPRPDLMTQDPQFSNRWAEYVDKGVAPPIDPQWAQSHLDGVAAEHVNTIGTQRIAYAEPNDSTARQIAQDPMLAENTMIGRRPATLINPQSDSGQATAVMYNPLEDTRERGVQTRIAVEQTRYRNVKPGSATETTINQGPLQPEQLTRGTTHKANGRIPVIDKSFTYKTIPTRPVLVGKRGTSTVNGYQTPEPKVRVRKGADAAALPFRNTKVPGGGWGLQ